MLDLDALKKTVTVNEADLKSYYEQNAASLSSKEERRASHILINAPKDMPAAEREKAKEKATALLEQARKTPAPLLSWPRKTRKMQAPRPAAVISSSLAVARW